jgi:hypothetical protein
MIISRKEMVSFKGREVMPMPERQEGSIDPKNGGRHGIRSSIPPAMTGTPTTEPRMNVIARDMNLSIRVFL